MISSYVSPLFPSAFNSSLVSFDTWIVVISAFTIWHHCVVIWNRVNLGVTISTIALYYYSHRARKPLSIDGFVNACAN